MTQLSFLCRENAADLFPRKISHDPWKNLDPEGFPELLENLSRDVRTFLNSLNEFPEFTDEDMNASILPFEKDLKVRNWPVEDSFITQFTDSTGLLACASTRVSNVPFHGLSRTIYQRPDQFRYPAVQRHIHKLTQEMGDHINGITSSLCMFIEVGKGINIPCLQASRH
jgi:WD repeat-containing protein 26